MSQVWLPPRSALLLLFFSLWQWNISTQATALQLPLSDTIVRNGTIPRTSANGFNPRSTRRTTIVKIIKPSTNSSKEIVIKPNPTLLKSLTTHERHILSKLGLIDIINGKNENGTLGTKHNSANASAKQPGKAPHEQVPTPNDVITDSWQFLNLGGGVFGDSEPTNQDR